MYLVYCKLEQDDGGINLFRTDIWGVIIPENSNRKSCGRDNEVDNAI